jgi:hypothetical protein
MTPPEGHPGQHAYTFVIRRRLSSQFQFSLSAVTLGIYLGGFVDCQEKQLTQRFNEGLKADPQPKSTLKIR